MRPGTTLAPASSSADNGALAPRRERSPAMKRAGGGVVDGSRLLLAQPDHAARAVGNSGPTEHRVGNVLSRMSSTTTYFWRQACRWIGLGPTPAFILGRTRVAYALR